MQPTLFAIWVEAVGILLLAARQKLHRRISLHRQLKECKCFVQECLAVPTLQFVAGLLGEHLNDGAILNQLEAAEVDGSGVSAEYCMPVIEPSVILALRYPDRCQLQTKQLEGYVRCQPVEIKSAVNDAIVQPSLHLLLLGERIPAAKLCK